MRRRRKTLRTIHSHRRKRAVIHLSVITVTKPLLEAVGQGESSSCTWQELVQYFCTTKVQTDGCSYFQTPRAAIANKQAESDNWGTRKVPMMSYPALFSKASSGGRLSSKVATSRQIDVVFVLGEGPSTHMEEDHRRGGEYRRREGLPINFWLGSTSLSDSKTVSTARTAQRPGRDERTECIQVDWNAISARNLVVARQSKFRVVGVLQIPLGSLGAVSLGEYPECH
ncbi:hypothetical protein DFP72DRAFT_846700 [Ephemerocybe angulata]|uniref:Uncharacterized protein n=1 Tax=Ephemerocybe angulata TaxID=980116 RepID=A0A8H6I1N5_9AGAR|nr:hypothetical protein DFP72DRAFT_846700 [Tulosesus angulatus]